MQILSLGEKIKRRRKSLDMTLKNLAAERITPGQISLVESGKSNPSMDLLEYLAEKLQTTTEYLMESEDSQAKKICLYYENMTEIYIQLKEYDKAKSYISDIVTYADKYDLSYRKGKALYFTGLINMHKGELEIAEQNFLSANVIFSREKNSEDIVNSLINLGKIAYFQKAYMAGNSHFAQAERVYIESSVVNEYLYAEILHYMAATNYKLGNLSRATHYSDLCKEVLQKLASKKDYAKKLLEMSNEFNKMGNMEMALIFSERSLKKFRDIKEDVCISDIENNLGKLYLEFDNFNESFVHFNNAKNIRETYKEESFTETLINICENYIAMKDSDSAEKTLNEIIKNVKKDDAITLINYYKLKYRASLLVNNVKVAEETLLEALKFSNGIGYTKEAGEISILLSKLYLENKSIEESKEYLNKGVKCFEKVGILGTIA